MTYSKMVKLSRKGQLVIPRPMRQTLGVKEGDELVATLEGGRVILTPPERYARETRGVLKGTWGKTRKQVLRYLEGERRSWE